MGDYMCFLSTRLWQNIKKIIRIKKIYKNENKIRIYNDIKFIPFRLPPPTTFFLARHAWSEIPLPVTGLRARGVAVADRCDPFDVVSAAMHDLIFDAYVGLSILVADDACDIVDDFVE